MSRALPRARRGPRVAERHRHRRPGRREIAGVAGGNLYVQIWPLTPCRDQTLPRPWHCGRVGGVCASCWGGRGWGSTLQQIRALLPSQRLHAHKLMMGLSAGQVGTRRVWGDRRGGFLKYNISELIGWWLVRFFFLKVEFSPTKRCGNFLIRLSQFDLPLGSPGFQTRSCKTQINHNHAICYHTETGSKEGTMPTWCAWGWHPCSRGPWEWQAQGSRVSTVAHRNTAIWCSILTIWPQATITRKLKNFKSERWSVKFWIQRTKQIASSDWFWGMLCKRNTICFPTQQLSLRVCSDGNTNNQQGYFQCVPKKKTKKKKHVSDFRKNAQANVDIRIITTL